MINIINSYSASYDQFAIFQQIQTLPRDRQTVVQYDRIRIVNFPCKFMLVVGVECHYFSKITKDTFFSSECIGNKICDDNLPFLIHILSLLFNCKKSLTGVNQSM